MHIYVNLIYLHFIVIYGLLCDFINMFCTEVTSRFNFRVTLSFCSLGSLDSHVACALFSQPSRASRRAVVSLAYNSLSFILAYTSTCPSGGPNLAPICRGYTCR